jgi:putative ABC transport system permease protein
MQLTPGLQAAGWRYLWKHALQTILMIVGISLGVAVVVAIDLANTSASRAFEVSAETVAGRATHQLSAGTTGIPEEVYTRLRMDHPEIPAAPTISETISSPQLGNVPLQLLGIDPFAEPPFRSYLGSGRAPASADLSSFLVRPGTVLISSTLASQYQIAPGRGFELDIAGKVQSVQLAGVLDSQSGDALTRRALDGLVLADISTAQELTGKIGVLDRIDLILPQGQPGEALAASLQADLPTGVSLLPSETRSGSLNQLTSAFRVNLTALSLLALVVGVFLIYNTMTFSVVQRRSLFGTLRCLGVTRGEIFTLVAAEALAAGLIGSALGTGLGLLMGQTTTRMILRTINDLYFTTTVSQVGLPLISLVKGAAAGIGASLLTAIPPAWEAASIPPRAALLRSTLETRTRRQTGVLTLAGLGMILLGGGWFAIPSTHLFTGFMGTLFVVVGFAMLSSFAIQAGMRLAAPAGRRLFGWTGSMAARNLVYSLSRTSVAVAALMVAVAVTIAVSIMIGSFRHTVIAWLEQSLRSDIYVSAPSFTTTGAPNPLDDRVIEKVLNWPGAERVDLLRQVEVNSPQGVIAVDASSNPSTGSERLFLSRQGDPAQMWEAMQTGGVLVSEPLYHRLKLPRQGGGLDLETPAGLKNFPIVGIYYDYASSRGTVVMALDVYQEIWKDSTITAAGLRLDPGEDVEAVSQQIRTELAPIQRSIVRPNRVLKAEVLEVFDRTFAITSALQILATVVAFIGVLNALLLLQLERQREIGILRAVGLSGRQLRGLVLLETSLMGGVSGILAMPAGYALALILVFIINQRSFGWTLQMTAGPGAFLQALGIAVGAAILAGIYPAIRLSRMPAAEAIRYE